MALSRPAAPRGGTGSPGRLGVGRQGRPSPFLVLSAVVITASVAVRLALLGRQSYWIDELFSVNQSSGSLQVVLTAGSTEVHTPLYAALLWVWISIGGSQETWTRLLSTVCGVVAVVVTSRGLRGLGLPSDVRWAMTVATAASGTSIVYSLETRSYALVLLGSVGLTVTTLRAALVSLDGDVVPRRTCLAWLGWSLLAATAHPFGAVLTVGAATVLGAVTAGQVRRRVARWVGLAAVACSPAIAWLAFGLTHRPGFAAGTDWIPAPSGRDVWNLITTVFGSGGLETRRDGFAWTSPLGVIAVIALCVATGLRGGQVRERRAAAVLLALAAFVVAVTFTVAQEVHGWTLRNLVIVSPALMWGMLCLAAGATGSDAARRRIATAAVALLGLGLVPMTLDLASPYKTDFRGLFAYLSAVRGEHPDVVVTYLGPAPPWGWRPASDRAGGLAWHPLYREVSLSPAATPDDVVRSGGSQVVVVYRRAVDPHPESVTSDLVARLGAGSCRSIPMHGFAVVRCD